MSVKGIEVTNATLTDVASHKQQMQVKVQRVAVKKEVGVANESRVRGAEKGHHGKNIAKVVEEINEVLEVLNREVRFSYNSTIRGFVVKVIDVKTGQVIREIPPKDVINLQKKLIEFVGMIFDSKEGSK